MKSNQIRQPIILAAIIAVAAFSVWYCTDRPTSEAPAQAAAPTDVQSSPESPREIAAADVSAIEVQAEIAVDPAVGEKKVIFPKLKNVSGHPIDLNGPEYLKAGMTGAKVRGRTADLDADAFASLGDLAEGDTVSFPSFKGELHGVIEVALVDDDGWRRVGGPLEGDRAKGWFSFGFNGHEARGLVRLNGEKLAYEIAPSATGGAQMIERPLTDFVCLGLPHFAAPPAPAPKRTAAAAAAAVVTPILNSRPAATAQILMDFDGDTVNDVEWGRIVAPASPLSAAQRADVFRRVKDDFLQFNINVTTDPAKYAAAKPGHRMRCIVTTVDTAAPGAGGVAYLNSFAYAGTIFTANIPCWCFNPTVKSIADTISHEVGHTFGLNHDGLVGRAEYYAGHGTGATSWGPIMGAPFTRSVTQWSKGEYKGANRYEFDIEIIANTVNAFGYAPDDAGDTMATAKPLGFLTGNDIEQRGVIDRIGDRDMFYFSSKSGGTLLVTAAGIGGQVGNCDVQIDVFSANGVLLGHNTFDRSIGAGLNVVVGSGKSYIMIRGAGDGDVNTTGYSDYGSHGAYTITGRTPP